MGTFILSWLHVLNFEGGVVDLWQWFKVSYQKGKVWYYLEISQSVQKKGVDGWIALLILTAFIVDLNQ